MIYSRAVYDLASIIKLVVDKLDPGDQVQILALLKNIKQYLDAGRIPVSVNFEEPAVTIAKLIQTVENINQVKQLNVHQTPATRELLVGGAPLLDNSAFLSTPPSQKKPPVSRHAGVKRAHPIQEPEDDYANDSYSYENDDDSQDVYEEVVQDETDWQPIDMLERALTVIANEPSSSKTVYVYEPSASKKAKTSKGGKKTSLKSTRAAKLYLPDHVNFTNPTAQIVRKPGDRRWPENTKWICVYCRLICKNLKCYKAHLNHFHKDDACSCRFCKRKFTNVEMMQFHLCHQRHHCPVCKKVFPRPAKLQRHLRVHYKSLRAKVRCMVCNEKYSHATTCARHIYEDHEMIVLCDCCGKDFVPNTTRSCDASRIYCDECADSATNGEPVADPANLNPDIEIIKVKFDSAIDEPLTKAVKAPKGTSGNTRRSTTSTSHYCEACDVTITGESTWKRHVLKRSHILTVAEKSGTKCEPLACPTCNRVFLNQEKLDFHSRVHKEGYARKSYECKTCGKQLQTLGGYRTHVAGHNSRRNFICDVCQKTFKTSLNLRDHKDSMHPDGKTFPCAFCEEKFSNRKIRSRHVGLIHHNYIYRCTECDYFTRKGDLVKLHIASYHPEIKWTQPKDYRHVADEPYDENEPTVKPNQLSIPKAEGAYTCDLCSLSYRTSYALTVHKESSTHIKNEAISQGLKPEMFSCNDCGKSFFSQKNLDRHIQLNHQADTPRFKCDYCDKQYLAKSGLREHLAIHTGERPFKCKSCDAAFPNSSSLSHHVNTKHLQKEYPCDWCNVIFHNRKMRTKHVNLVHFNYAYRCTECGHEVRSDRAIHRHISLKHPSIKWTKPIDYRVVATKPHTEDGQESELEDMSPNEDFSDEELSDEEFSAEELSDEEFSDEEFSDNDEHVKTTSTSEKPDDGVGSPTLSASQPAPSTSRIVTRAKAKAEPTH